MIVENKQLIIELAQNTAKLMLQRLVKETYALKIQDEPAENVYFYLHVTSFLYHSLIKAIKEFCATFGIEYMTQEKIIELVAEIIKEIADE